MRLPLGLLALALLAPLWPAPPRRSRYASGRSPRPRRRARSPVGLLPALALVESGRADANAKLRPWPWTIDVDGRGYFFPTKGQAVSAVRALQAGGVRSIDVGCLQVNLLHHPDAFASLDRAFDPAANTRYAARFLLALHARDSDWAHAIAAYHSETPKLGAAYRARVLAIWHPEGADSRVSRPIHGGRPMPISCPHRPATPPSPGAIASASRAGGRLAVASKAG